MGYLLAILFALGIVGTGAGYWHGIDVGEARQQAKTAVAQAKVDEQVKQLRDKEVQHQADIVAAFDLGRSKNEQKAQIVYVKGGQAVAADSGIRNPVCVMAADSMGLLNAARAGAEVGASYELKPAAPAVVVPRVQPVAPAPIAPPVSTHPKPRPISDLDLRLLGLNQ
jgi:hypothetical protein